MRLITIVLQCRQLEKRSTTTSGNYGYGGGDGDGDWIWNYGGGRWLFFSSSPRFSSRGVSLYLGAFMKVVLFDDAMAAATIWADQNGPTV